MALRLPSMPAVHWRYSWIGIALVMSYAAWMLYGNVQQVTPVLAPDLVQHEGNAGPQKGDEDLIRQLRESNAFGKVALAHMFWCDGRVGPWDEVCHIGGASDPANPTKLLPGGLKFGVVMDSGHITRMSGLYPAEGPTPPFSEAETISSGEPAREQLPCGGPGYTATYFPATKFFGPALNVRFRPTEGAMFRTVQAMGQAADAALRTCIQFLGRRKPLAGELPATAWVAQPGDLFEVVALPGFSGRGVSEHLVYDPHTRQIRIWTERSNLTPPWRTIG